VYENICLDEQLHTAYDTNLRRYMQQLFRTENPYIRNKFCTRNEM